jgi:flagellar basal-body rod protein FlgG
MPSVSLTTLMHIARSGLLAQQMNIDVIANNLANLNTTGFKESRANFKEILDSSIGEIPQGQSRTPGQGAGALLADNQRLFHQGNIQESDNPWDLAIEGEGFFQVRMPDGTIGYTRDGSFRLDANGRLVTSDGYLMQPAITIPADAEETSIDPTGVVMVKRTNQAAATTIGTITLARFNNPEGLENVGGNIYIPTDASGTAIAGKTKSTNPAKIVTRALEGSNVEISQQMVDMISAQRAYTLMVKALETSDEMMSIVNQMRR